MHLDLFFGLNITDVSQNIFFKVESNTLDWNINVCQRLRTLALHLCRQAVIHNLLSSSQLKTQDWSKTHENKNTVKMLPLRTNKTLTDLCASIESISFVQNVWLMLIGILK